MKMIALLVSDDMDYEKDIEVAIRKYKPLLKSYRYLDEPINNETTDGSSESEDNIDDEKEEEGEQDVYNESTTI